VTARSSAHVVAALLLVAMLAASACASVPRAQRAPTIDVTGVWFGSWIMASAAGHLVLTLRQNGDDVTVEGDSGYGRGRYQVIGKVAGNTFYTTSGTYRFYMHVSGDRMLGRTSSGATIYLQRDRERQP
jgi:hypothetical protein